jgi:hypothetical protein
MGEVCAPSQRSLLWRRLGDRATVLKGCLMTNTVSTTWMKSSRSASGDVNCVEVSLIGADQVVVVRDSQVPDEATLTFRKSTWLTFIRTVKLGLFDLPTADKAPL